MAIMMDLFRGEMAARLEELESYLCDDLGLGMDKLTLVARKPGDAEMFVVLTNDDLGEVIGLLNKERAKDTVVPVRPKPNTVEVSCG